MTCYKRRRKAFLLACPCTSKCPRPLSLSFVFFFFPSRLYGQKLFDHGSIISLIIINSQRATAHKSRCNSSKFFASSWVYNYALTQAPVICCLDLWELLSSDLISYPCLLSNFWNVAARSNFSSASITFSGVIITVLKKQAASSTIV